MKKIVYRFPIFIFFIASIFLSYNELSAQEVRKPTKISSEETAGFQLKYGMGLSTRYLWRGLDLASSPALEPYGQVLFSNFEISLYGIYGLFENAAKHPDFVRPQNPDDFSPIYLDKIAFNEVISNFFYHIKADFGTIRIGFTENYFSDGLVKKYSYTTDSLGNVTDTSVYYPKSTWLNWDDNGTGAHTIEASLRFDGKKTFPFWFFIGINVYNDPENSLYIESGYTFNVQRNKLTLVLGSAIGASSWYQFNFKDGVFRGDFMTNFGLTFSREIYLDDWLIVDFALSDVVNFYEERNTILFKTTLKIE
jgi:hypothetical protein